MRQRLRDSESETESDSVSSEETPDGMFGCLLMLLAWHRSESGCMVLPSSARTPMRTCVGDDDRGGDVGGDHSLLNPLE